MANNWKKVNIDFRTVKLGDFIEPIKKTYAELNDENYSTVYGVSNTEGICITGKETSKDISKYIALENDCFAFNPYRVNVGSIGINSKGLKGCVSPAYVVFKTKNKLNPYFLYHYLKSDYGNHLINWYGNRGGVRNALRYDDLCKIDIPEIDLSTQLILLENIQKYSDTLQNLSHESVNQSSYLTKLRQAILQEAIEGKLTAAWRKENPVRKGDPDFDAEALLAKIQAEKEKLIKEGKIKKQKPLAPIKAEEVPFELPEGWVWTRLGEICDSITKGTTPAAHELLAEGEIPYLKVYNIVNQKINFFYRPQYINRDVHSRLSRSKVYPGDVLMNIVGPPLGKVAMIPDTFPEWNINQALTIFRCLVKIVNRYIYYYLLEGSCINSIQVLGVVGQDNISLEQSRDIIIAIPSIAEQETIVDRVRKFLLMVDELEIQVSERKEQSEQLLQTVFREALSVINKTTI